MPAHQKMRQTRNELIPLDRNLKRRRLLNVKNIRRFQKRFFHHSHSAGKLSFLSVCFCSFFFFVCGKFKAPQYGLRELYSNWHNGYFWWQVLFRKTHTEMWYIAEKFGKELEWTVHGTSAGHIISIRFATWIPINTQCIHHNWHIFQLFRRFYSG